MGTANFGECYIVEVDHWVEKSDTISMQLHSHVKMLIDKAVGKFPFCSSTNTEVSR